MNPSCTVALIIGTIPFICLHPKEKQKAQHITNSAMMTSVWLVPGNTGEWAE